MGAEDGKPIINANPATARNSWKQSTCPHCGHQQKESSHLISTFCRACGEHYLAENIVLLEEQQQELEKKSPILNRVLTCYRCGHQHPVSVHAQITICIQCNTSISLMDVTVAQPTSQDVDTRGNLLVSPKGYLKGSVSICNSALIKGKVSGTLICEETARLFGKGSSRAKLIAKQIIIEKDAHLSLYSPLYTEELIVYGKLDATIYCRGMVHIHKKGFLEGPVWARGIEVSRHGHYSGNLKIQDKVEEIPAPSYLIAKSYKIEGNQ